MQIPGSKIGERKKLGSQDALPEQYNKTGI